ncbi:UbiA family prenyltransferase [Flavobacterium sp. CS20]|uniref:UbiA family prenyltransferase n=1 Tax=Flavobacterium sp. CS20 TaxID=2775246 RepID=UPI001B3A3D2B|nr:UbiA family prenyltransferase [Flavobacterium sp. CS20]QTY25915.1 UbiA family prenyltransferase [Flavobacterium sp. CS20]
MRYSFLKRFEINSILNLFDFSLVSFSIILIVMTGNVINDIFDIKTDFVNKRQRPLAQKKIGVSQAYSIYVILNLIAIVICLYISYNLQRWALVGVEVLVIILLYLYAKFLKAVPILGNVLVSLLVSLSFVLVLYFDVNISILLDQKIFKWVLFYSVFAFWTNLNREWIKDIIDIKGDYAQKISTLPILIGKSRMNTLIFISTLFLILTLLLGVKVYLKANLFFVLYFIFGVCIPLAIVMYKIWNDENHISYKKLSLIYKFTMLIGVCSLILFKI